MKYTKIIVFSILVVFLLGGFSILYTQNYLSYVDSQISVLDKNIPKAEPPDLRFSSQSNQYFLNSVFNAKIQDYFDIGYFPNIYEPSLQATYYGLYILSTVGKLDYINHSEIIDYIMSFYDAETDIFMDTLARRYLDTDFEITYFPLSTVLEVNCYAVLSLEILRSLDTIDVSAMIDFIWSCQEPISGGFIGQPYDFGLDEGFKISTADNTYFAVKVLDLLLSDWSGYSAEKSDIIQFINNLQLSGGGFENDEDPTFDSLYPIFEPNLLSSFYAIKSLETFGMVSSINLPNFHSYLESLNQGKYFGISFIPLVENHTNLVATSLALELSNITEYSGIDKEAAVTFLLNHRNSLGNWDQSTSIPHHELIDTFQIIRSLNNTQEINRLSLQERNDIGNATFYYKSYQGFSLLSEDYTSLKLLYTIVNSFYLFDKISELAIQQLYTKIKNSYEPYIIPSISRFFYGYLLHDTPILGFRSYPIEYYTQGYKDHFDKLSLISSHENTFLALDILEKMFKLDDFVGQYGLMDLTNDIVATQFLNGSYYNNFGGFSYVHKYTGDNSENINKKIYCDYSYYAIRTLEIIADYLSVNLADLGVDTDALYTYLDRNIVETASEVYFEPGYSSDVEITLRCTYYMIYMLDALDMYDKNNMKIENYILSNLDYTNIENIYYCYKISEILSLNIDFNATLIQELVPNLFSDSFDEFSTTIEKIDINQEVFLWICEMARNSEIEISATFDHEIVLGQSNEMNAILHNLILTDFGTYITFKFESSQMGTIIFDKLLDNTYSKQVPIPISPNCYPEINGRLCAYEGTTLKAELPISFSTTYNLTYSVSSHQGLSSWKININSSIISGNSYHQLIEGQAYIRIYVDDIDRGTEYFTHTLFGTYSLFSLEHTPGIEGDYYIEIYLDDGFELYQVGEISFHQGPIIGTEIGEIGAAIPLTVTLIAIPGLSIILTSRKLKSNKESNLK